MSSPWKIAALGSLLCLSLFSCQSFMGFGGSSGTSAGSAYSGEGIRFLVKGTHGMVQVRGPLDADWRFLEPGESLSPGCFVRTGFNSSADLVMIEHGREVDVQLGSLLPELVLADAYDKILSPEGYRKYIEDRAERKGACAAGRAVLVCRNTLAQLEDNDFLEVANLNLELKNISAGRSSAVGGASTGSAGGTGGGC